MNAPTKHFLAAIAALMLIATGCSTSDSDEVTDVSSEDESVEETHSHDDDGEHDHDHGADGHDHDDDGDTVSDETFDEVPSCFTDRWSISEIWLEAPRLGPVEFVEQRQADGSTSELAEFNVVDATVDERSPSAWTTPIEQIVVGRDFEPRFAKAPSSDGPEVAFIISNMAGFGFGGAIDIVDNTLWTWTVCDDEWLDLTEPLTTWANSKDPAVVLEQLKAVVLTSRATEEGNAIRETESRRLDETIFGAPDEPVAWADRLPHQRTWLDEDVPAELIDRLVTTRIHLGQIDAVGDPDLAVCPRQADAGVGYCFTIDALAQTGSSVIEVAVLPDQPLQLMLNRESRWNEPEHEIALGEIAGTERNAEISIVGKLSREGLAMADAAAELAIEFTVTADREIDMTQVQVIGGGRPDPTDRVEVGTPEG